MTTSLIKKYYALLLWHLLLPRILKQICPFRIWSQYIYQETLKWLLSGLESKLWLWPPLPKPIFFTLAKVDMAKFCHLVIGNVFPYGHPSVIRQRIRMVRNRQWKQSYIYIPYKCTIITCFLYIFTPFLKTVSLFLRTFLENSGLIYGWYF